MKLNKKALFNETGDIEISKRRVINGNATNLNDFNNIKYDWTSKWYRQAMNNFWIPEEINLASDINDYKELSVDEKNAYDKILSFLVFLDSIQTANLPYIGEYITANEINLCLAIQTYQEAIHSQSYGYILDTIASPEERNSIIYQWLNDVHLLKRNRFIGNIYNEFQDNKDTDTFIRVLIANYILEGIYFYSGFMFFYNLARNGKMSGTVQEIRYINRDENTHLWLFQSILNEIRIENPELFTTEKITAYKEMIIDGVNQEIEWGVYVLGNKIKGLNETMISDYIMYLGNLRSSALGFGNLFETNIDQPETMKWINDYNDANKIKTDFFEAKPSAYAKSTLLEDDL